MPRGRPSPTVSMLVHQAIPLVERHHRIVEELRASAPRPVTVAELAAALGVSGRSVERDVQRLRDAGIPVCSTRGPAGGYVLDVPPGPRMIELTAGETAALIASMVAVGPLASATAQSALDKLIAALAGGAAGHRPAGR